MPAVIDYNPILFSEMDPDQRRLAGYVVLGALAVIATGFIAVGVGVVEFGAVELASVEEAGIAESIATAGSSEGADMLTAQMLEAGYTGEEIDAAILQMAISRNLGVLMAEAAVADAAAGSANLVNLLIATQTAELATILQATGSYFDGGITGGAGNSGPGGGISGGAGAASVAPILPAIPPNLFGSY